MKISNGDMPAMPCDMASNVIYGGLTKREQFAMAAMQGFATDGGYASPSDAAHDAVKWADALLAELDRDGGE